MEKEIEKDIVAFRKDVAQCWSKKTSHKSTAQNAGPQKGIGQCVVTSLLFSDFLKKKYPNNKINIAIGDVFDSNGNVLINNHGWVEIEENNKILVADLTFDQAGTGVPFLFLQESKSNSVIYEKNKNLKNINADNHKDLLRRYDLLKKSYENVSQEEHFCLGQELPKNKFLQKGDDLGSKILIIGEAPAPNGWRKSGKAFYTVEGKIIPTGKNLQLLLTQINNNLSLENISFTEIVKCFVGGNRKKLMSCAEKTWGHFISQIDYLNPRLILLLGQKTTDIFNKLNESNLTVGRISTISVKNKEYPILPIYHPSPLNPKRGLNQKIIEDNLKKIKEYIKN